MNTLLPTLDALRTASPNGGSPPAGSPDAGSPDGGPPVEGAAAAATRTTAAYFTQSAAQADKIAVALREILTAQSLPDKAAQLAHYGFTADRLAEGLSLQADAQEAFNARQQAAADELLAFDHLRACRQAARDTYSYFRKQARTAFPAKGDRTALTLGDPKPDNTQKLLTLARAAYAAAGQPAYATLLDGAGFGPAQVIAALAGLDALEAANDAAQATRVRARQATAARNGATTALDLWMKRFNNALSHVDRRAAAAGTAARVGTANRQAAEAAGDRLAEPPVAA